MSRAIYQVLGAMMALGLLAVPQNAEATIVWNFSTEFSGSGDTLSGSVVVTLDDGGGSGSVDVTVDTSNLSLTEKITGLYLNLDPSFDLSGLSASFPVDNTDPAATVDISADTFKADGDGFFDILISWPVSEPGIFGINETDMITFTLAGLVEESFLFLSSEENADGTAKSGDKGPFLAALFAQSLGANGEGSGWFDPGGEIPVPEPGSLALFGFGLAGLALAVRGRRKIS